MSRDLAVVIPAFETPTTALKKCLDSVLRQIRSGDSIEVIVVDSSSVNLSHEFSSYRDRVQFFFPGRRMYAGEARNFGAAQTKKKILAFLDSDCCWSDRWLDIAEWSMIKYPKGLAFNGKILFEDPKKTWALALHLMEFHEFLGAGERHQRFLHSGNLLIQSEFFHSAGGFRPDWKACEDIGFLQKIDNYSEVQNKIHYIPDLAIIHSAHLTEKERIFEKVRFMGYWRGFYDHQLPKEFQLSIRTFFSRFSFFFGLVFWIAIIWRSVRLKSVLLKDVFTQSPKILKLTLLWAQSFRTGRSSS